MKAILILEEMPKSCGECLIYNDSQMLCCGSKIRAKEINTIPSICPLKPLPQIKEERLKYLRDIGASIRELQCYIIGHDDCIDEILGEENE